MNYPSTVVAPIAPLCPHVPIHGLDDKESLSFPPATLEEDDYTNIDSDPEVTDNEDRRNAIAPTVESCLQDVVTFPLAFPNSAYHEVQLLKLLHDIGAPNYSFKSFMD